MSLRMSKSQIKKYSQRSIASPNNSENQVKLSGTTPQSSPQSGTPSTNPSTPETSPIHQAELLPTNLDDLTVRFYYDKKIFLKG